MASTKPRPIGPVQSAADCRWAVVTALLAVRCSQGHELGNSPLEDGVGLHYVLYRGGPRKCQTCKAFEGMD